MLLLYAIAYQLERRIDRALTWEDAQTWDLALDLEPRPDPDRRGRGARVRRDGARDRAPAGGRRRAHARAARRVRARSGSAEEREIARRAGEGGAMSVGLVVEIIGDASKLAKGLGQAEQKVGGIRCRRRRERAQGRRVRGRRRRSPRCAIADDDGGRGGGSGGAAQARGGDRGGRRRDGDEHGTGRGRDRAGQERRSRIRRRARRCKSLVTATGDVTRRPSSSTGAQDIARFAGVDLATAADAVAKAEAGQDGALRKLMPGTREGRDGDRHARGRDGEPQGRPTSTRTSAGHAGESGRRVRRAVGDDRECLSPDPRGNPAGADAASSPVRQAGDEGCCRS